MPDELTAEQIAALPTAEEAERDEDGVRKGRFRVQVSAYREVRELAAIQFRPTEFYTLGGFAGRLGRYGTKNWQTGAMLNTEPEADGTYKLRNFRFVRMNSQGRIVGWWSDKWAANESKHASGRERIA